MADKSLSLEEKYRKRLYLKSKEIFVKVSSDTIKIINLGRSSTVDILHLDTIDQFNIYGDTLELNNIGYTINKSFNDSIAINKILIEKAELSKKLIHLQSILDTVVVFENTSYDLDTLNAGEKIETTFSFMNLGELPFTIDSLEKKCGCTSASIRKDTYLNGEKGEIKVTFDSTNKYHGDGKQVVLIHNNLTCLLYTSDAADE